MTSDHKLEYCRLVIFDKCNMNYLIDTDADISVIPPQLNVKAVKSNEYTLYAANGTAIDTFGS